MRGTRAVYFFQKYNSKQLSSSFRIKFVISGILRRRVFGRTQSVPLQREVPKIRQSTTDTAIQPLYALVAQTVETLEQDLP